VKPEKLQAMLAQVDQTKLAAALPVEVRTALATHGLHKVAAQLIGVPELTEVTAAQYLGRKLAARNAENKVIVDGLAALVTLTE